MNDDLEHIWARIRADLTTAVSESTYRIWLEPLAAVELTGDRLVIAAPQRTRDWIGDRFGRVLQACVAAVLGPEIDVDLIGAGAGAGAGVVDRRSGAGVDRRSGARSPVRSRRADSGRVGRSAARTFAPPAEPEHHSGDPILNPRLTFDQFVIGDANRLAHAAALTVAEMPSQAYNPLFICGSPGLGKTHLLHSIATYVLAHGGGLSVRYTTGEAFTSEFLAALGSGGLDGFKARFRHVDVLLVDDVQFLQGKARTEEEFFHTFNALSDVGSQVVVTSDRLPRDLGDLEDRLRERFEAGLVADIRPPDLATRLAILRKRVHRDGATAAEDPGVLRVIAERVASNVRTLEGALIRVVAFASLTSRPVTADLAREVMDNLYPEPRCAPRSLAEIRLAACKHFGVSDDEIVSRSRVARVAWPRHAAMFLARELTDESLPAIGREFGGRDHSTVLHACRRAGERIAKDAEAAKAVETLRAQLRAAPS